jgi:hypothetical protein
MTLGWLGPWYDGVWAVVALSAAVLLVMALSRWFRAHRPGLFGLAELVVVIALPVIGAGVYLFVTSRENPSTAE